MTSPQRQHSYSSRSNTTLTSPVPLCVDQQNLDPAASRRRVRFHNRVRVGVAASSISMDLWYSAQEYRCFKACLCDQVKELLVRCRQRGRSGTTMTRKVTSQGHDDDDESADCNKPVLSCYHFKKHLLETFEACLEEEGSSSSCADFCSSAMMSRDNDDDDNFFLRSVVEHSFYLDDENDEEEYIATVLNEVRSNMDIIFGLERLVFRRMADDKRARRTRLVQTVHTFQQRFSSLSSLPPLGTPTPLHHQQQQQQISSSNNNSSMDRLSTSSLSSLLSVQHQCELLRNACERITGPSRQFAHQMALLSEMV